MSRCTVEQAHIRHNQCEGKPGLSADDYVLTSSQAAWFHLQNLLDAHREYERMRDNLPAIESRRREYVRVVD